MPAVADILKYHDEGREHNSDDSDPGDSFRVEGLCTTYCGLRVWQ